MTNLARHSLLVATAFALAGCGGGGGGISSIGSTPPPAPPPPPPPPPPAAAFVLIPEAKTSQQFAVAGASYGADRTATLGEADQLQVRYVQSSNSYEIQLPRSQAWTALVGKSEVEAAGGGVTVAIQYLNFKYSSLINWFSGGALAGTEALGIATPAGAVPVTGTATYAAMARGSTPEINHPIVEPAVIGPMTFNFDFAHGSLSGSFTATLDPEWSQFELGTFNFRDTIYATGSTTFSGKFDTNAAGANSFNGLFTGPGAQELIGKFAFPYQSPIDGKVYQAAGAFVGAK